MSTSSSVVNLFSCFSFTFVYAYTYIYIYLFIYKFWKISENGWRPEYDSQVMDSFGTDVTLPQPNSNFNQPHNLVAKGTWTQRCVYEPRAVNSCPPIFWFLDVNASLAPVSNSPSKRGHLQGTFEPNVIDFKSLVVTVVICFAGWDRQTDRQTFTIHGKCDVLDWIRTTRWKF